MKQYIILLIAYSILLAYLFNKIAQRRKMKNGFVKYVDVVKFNEIQNKTQLIDVRSKDEYNVSKILGSRNIPIDQLRNARSKLHTNKPVYLYCASGKRASKAATMLYKQGFTDITVMKDSFDNYAGKKVISK